jgi:hypothetical protein
MTHSYPRQSCLKYPSRQSLMDELPLNAITDRGNPTSALLLRVDDTRPPSTLLLVPIQTPLDFVWLIVPLGTLRPGLRRWLKIRLLLVESAAWAWDIADGM